MTTESEIAHEAYLDKLDENRDKCTRCDRTDRVTDLQRCIECGEHICCDCANETFWELEACSDVCARAIAAKLIREVRDLRRMMMARHGAPDAELAEFSGRKAA